MENLEYFNLARSNMVKNQLMPNHINNEIILNAFNLVPRHEFVPTELQSIAYSDGALPLNQHRFMIPAEVLARLIANLKPSALNQKKTVLDVACGHGYSTAILSLIFEKVIAIEPDEEFAKAASKNLKRLGLINVDVFHSDITSASSEVKYDMILIAGALKEVPLSLVSKLKNGGKLIYIKTITPYICKAMLMENIDDYTSETELFDTFCQPLIF